MKKASSFFIIVTLVMGCMCYAGTTFSQEPWGGYRAAPGAPPGYDPYLYYPSRHNDDAGNRVRVRNQRSSAVVAHLDDASARTDSENGLNDSSRRVSKYNVDFYDNVDVNHWEDNGESISGEYYQYLEELMTFIENDQSVSGNEEPAADEMDRATERTARRSVRQIRNRHVIRSEHQSFRSRSRTLSKFNVDSYENNDSRSGGVDENFFQNLENVLNIAESSNTGSDDGENTAAEYDESANEAAKQIANDNDYNTGYNHNTVNYSLPSVYSLLTADEKSVYDAIYPGASEAKKEITISGKFENIVIRNAVLALMHDHPEFMWIQGGYSYSYYENQNMTKLGLDYNAFASDPAKYKKEMEDAAAVLISEARKYKTPEAMERYLFEQLKTNTDYTHSDYDQTAYSALVWRMSVCKGSAMALKYLLNQVGIPSFVVSSDDHAWNIVQINGQWYYADASAYATRKGRDNAVKNGSIFDRFNVTSSEYSETPEWDSFPNDRLPRVR